VFGSRITGYLSARILSLRKVHFGTWDNNIVREVVMTGTYQETVTRWAVGLAFLITIIAWKLIYSLCKNYLTRIYRGKELTRLPVRKNQLFFVLLESPGYTLLLEATIPFTVKLTKAALKFVVNNQKNEYIAEEVAPPTSMDPWPHATHFAVSIDLKGTVPFRSAEARYYTVINSDDTCAGWIVPDTWLVMAWTVVVSVILWAIAMLGALMLFIK
jgi:hypothetical protein